MTFILSILAVLGLMFCMLWAFATGAAWEDRRISRACEEGKPYKLDCGVVRVTPWEQIPVKQ